MKVSIQVLRRALKARLGKAFERYNSGAPGDARVVSKEIMVPSDWWGASNLDIRDFRGTASIKFPGRHGWKAVSLRLLALVLRIDTARLGRHESVPGVKWSIGVGKKDFGMEFFPVNWRRPVIMSLNMRGLAQGKRIIAGPFAFQLTTSPSHPRFDPPIITDDQFRKELEKAAKREDSFVGEQGTDECTSLETQGR